MILGYAGYLENKLDPEDPNYQFVHEIKRESKRCKKIVQDLRFDDAKFDFLRLDVDGDGEATERFALAEELTYWLPPSAVKQSGNTRITGPIFPSRIRRAARFAAPRRRSSSMPASTAMTSAARMYFIRAPRSKRNNFV